MSVEDSPNYINMKDSATVAKYGNAHLSVPKSSEVMVMQHNWTFEYYLFICFQMLKRTFIHVNGEDILKRKEMFKAETIQIGISSKFQYVCQVLFNPLLPVGRYINMDSSPLGLLISWTYSICFGQFFFSFCWIFMNQLQLSSIIANNIQLRKCPVKIFR